VVHHSDCGMEYFTSAQLATLLEGSLSTAAIVADPAAPKGVAFKNAAQGGGCAAGHAVHWLHIEDQEASVREDVAKIAAHELVAVRSETVKAARAQRTCVAALESTRASTTPSPLPLPNPPYHAQPGIPVHGFIYDVKTGKINHVVSAMTRA
jgi:carbonic anhydrase